MKLLTSRGLKGSKKQSIILMRLNVKLLSMVGTISFMLRRRNSIDGYKQHSDLTFEKQNTGQRKKLAHLPLYCFDFELKFYVPLDTKQVILETFFPANLWSGLSSEETKPNATKAHIHPKHYNTTTENKQKLKPCFIDLQPGNRARPFHSCGDPHGAPKKLSILHRTQRNV